MNYPIFHHKWVLVQTDHYELHRFILYLNVLKSNGNAELAGNTRSPFICYQWWRHTGSNILQPLVLCHCELCGMLNSKYVMIGAFVLAHSYLGMFSNTWTQKHSPYNLIIKSVSLLRLVLEAYIIIVFIPINCSDFVNTYLPMAKETLIFMLGYGPWQYDFDECLFVLIMLISVLVCYYCLMEFSIFITFYPSLHKYCLIRIPQVVFKCVYKRWVCI